MIDEDEIIGRKSDGFGEPERKVAPLSHLETLRIEVAEQAERGETDDDIVKVEVPERPGWLIECSVYGFGYEQLAALRKRALSRDMPGGVHELRLAALIIATTCRAVTKNGENIGDGDTPVKFRDPALKDALGAKDAVDAVIVFFGNDFHVGAASNEILLKAGIGDDVSTIAAQDAGGPTGR